MNITESHQLGESCDAEDVLGSCEVCGAARGSVSSDTALTVQVNLH